LTQELLNADYEIGQLLQDQIIPRAVLYFTGDALDDMDDDDEGEDEDEDDDEEGLEGAIGDDNSDDDSDYRPPEGAESGPPGCKQQ